jgi:hypothetical protein
MKDADTTWALVVGIDVYDHVRKLKGPVRDAIAVVGWLRQLGLTDDRILLHASPSPESRDLLNDLGTAHRGCTEPEIWQSLSTLLSNSGSRLFVFLLGHGYYLFDGGCVFLTKEADTNAMTNFGIGWLSDLLRAKNYQRQFILMDGCMNYAYAASQRPTITSGEHPGVAVGAALPSVSQWFGYAASQGQTAAEPDSRGLFTTTLLAALDPAKPNPLCTTIDDATGAYQLDLVKAITDIVNPTVAQQIPTQRPGIRRLDTGPANSQALVAAITPAHTVALRTLVDPMTAVPDIDYVTLVSQEFPWQRKIPHPTGSALNLPLTSVLPAGLKLIGWCEMKPNTDWADPEVERVTTGTAAEVVFKLNRDRSIDVVKVTTVGVDDTVVAAMNSNAVTEATSIIARAGAQGKVWLSPSRTGGIVFVTAGEEGHLDSVSRRIADAIDRNTRSDVHTTLERQQLPPAESKPRWHGWMLDVDLSPEQARALGGFLAERPLVRIGDSRRGTSLLNLADIGQIAIDGFAPVRVALNLPWGRWVTIVEPPDDEGNTSPLVFPDVVGLPPVRNSLRGTVLQPESEAFAKIGSWKTAFALAVTTTEPAELHVGTGDLASRLCSGDDRTDDWPALYGADKEMPGGPNLYRDDQLMEADWPIGKLDVGSSRTSLFFPMSHPNLAFDDRFAPRIEPLSVSTAPLWDLLVSTGRLEAPALDLRGVERILKSGDPLLTLVGMYGCYVNGFGESLVWLQRFFPEESEDPDVIILRHAYAMKFPGAELTSELSVNVRRSQFAALATDGRVPKFKWGLGIGQAVAQHFDVPALAKKLKRIEDRLLTASIWTLWHGDEK